MIEIDREDPIFIENEGVSLAPRTGMTGQRMGTIGQGLHPLGRMRPFAMGLGRTEAQGLTQSLWT